MYKVLLIDDDAFILEGLKVIIDWEEYGLEIAGQASNGIKALELLKQQTFHILITDIKMPYMDGIELIKNIRNEEIDIKIIILSGYDDFKYVREAVKLSIENYLLKPINPSELSSTLSNTIENIEKDQCNKIRQPSDLSILKSNILYRWVTGSISNKELNERAEFLNIDLSRKYYLICLLRVMEIQDKSTKKCSQVNNNYEHLISSVCNILHESLNPDYHPYIFPDMNNDIVILISFAETQIDNEKLLTSLKICMNHIQNQLQLNTFSVIGNLSQGYQEISQSYENAVELLEYCLVLPQNSIADYESIKVLKGSSDILPNEVDSSISTLKDSVIKMDLKQANKNVDDIYSKLYGQSNINPEYLRRITIELIYMVMNSLNTRKIGFTGFANNLKMLYARAYATNSFSELSSLVKIAVENVIDFQKSIKDAQTPTVTRVISYIDNNYFEDLSLKTLSAKLNFNAAYLGQLFKTETGEMFTAYLNRVRIEKAKELLLSTRLTSIEVAKKVGYVNTKYFSNIFKKITGVYPSDFKMTFSNNP